MTSRYFTKVWFVCYHHISSSLTEFVVWSKENFEDSFENVSNDRGRLSFLSSLTSVWTEGETSDEKNHEHEETTRCLQSVRALSSPTGGFHELKGKNIISVIKCKSHWRACVCVCVCVCECVCVCVSGLAKEGIVGAAVWGFFKIQTRKNTFKHFCVKCVFRLKFCQTAWGSIGSNTEWWWDKKNIIRSPYSCSNGVELVSFWVSM